MPGTTGVRNPPGTGAQRHGLSPRRETCARIPAEICTVNNLLGQSGLKGWAELGLEHAVECELGLGDEVVAEESLDDAVELQLVD